MTTRTMGPAAGWRWLLNAVNLGGGNPRAVLGGAVLLMLVALVPTVVQLVVQNGLGIASVAATIALLVLSLAYSLLVMGPLSAGYLRLLQAGETGAPTRANAIFDIFNDRGTVARVIGVLVSLFAIVLVLMAAVMAVFGTEFFMQIAAVMEVLENQSPDSAPALPPMPSGVGTLMGLAFILGMFLNGAYAIAMGQVALGGRGVRQALGDGLLGALRNLLPLLVLSIVGTVLGFVVLLVFGVVIGVLMLVGSLVHPALGMLLAAPVYLAMMVALYVVMFGIMYYIWRDVCGGQPDAGGAHEVAA